MNPWSALPSEAPYVLPADWPVVELFNRSAGAPVRIETALMPEPYVGRVDAPVVILTLNPGVSPGDFALHEDPAFRRRVLDCHRQEPAEYPNYYLDPAIAGPGARWMHRIARPLVATFGAPAVSRSLALIEFFPYHSARFAHGAVSVPSQAYAFALARAAVDRGAAIFITRGRALWHEAVPELRAYPRVFRTQSAQNIVISPRNCLDGYPVVAEAVIRDGTRYQRGKD